MVDFLLYEASLEASPADLSRQQRVSARRARGGVERKKRTNPFENVVDERVQDEHGLVRDTSVGVNLLEDLVDVGRVGLLASTLLLLLVTFSSGCLLDGFLSGSFSSGSFGSRGLASSRSGFLLFEIEG